MCQQDLIGSNHIKYISIKEPQCLITMIQILNILVEAAHHILDIILVWCKI